MEGEESNRLGRYYIFPSGNINSVHRRFWPSLPRQPAAGLRGGWLFRRSNPIGGSKIRNFSWDCFAKNARNDGRRVGRNEISDLLKLRFGDYAVSGPKDGGTQLNCCSQWFIWGIQGAVIFSPVEFPERRIHYLLVKEASATTLIHFLPSQTTDKKMIIYRIITADLFDGDNLERKVFGLIAFSGTKGRFSAARV